MTHIADLCVIMKSNYGEKPLFLFKKITTRSDSIICEHVYTNMLNLILFGGGFSRCFVLTKISSAVPLIRVLEYCILWLY